MTFDETPADNDGATELHTQRTLRDGATGVSIAETPERLATIKDAGCAAVIWRRQPAPGFETWINACDPAVLPTGRLILRPDAVPDAVQNLCDIAGLETGPQRAWLEADIADLARRFTAIMRAPYLRLRLDAITSNACRKFHIDAIMARLICTYRGSGTQYGIAMDGAEPDRVFQVATGAPMILRGTRWPESPRSGLLHRSPPIAGTGETRLVLVLDPIFDIEDADG
ncbi:MAG: DUF1826 domain-containing protein [Pseudomonadota bacterium]